MDQKKAQEERLREYCCIGDERNVQLLIERGVNINASNHMNGWTPLHWAAKRGHKNLTEYLIKQGADTTTLTTKGETAAQLSTDASLKEMLGESGSLKATTESLPIVPNYLRNPEFFYAERDDSSKPGSIISKTNNHAEVTSTTAKACSVSAGGEIVLRLRIADSEETDFIEVDVDSSSLTFKDLERLCCEELCLEVAKIKKIRKLPNTIVRNDRDVKRLLSFQELEVVLSRDAS